MFPRFPWLGRLEIVFLVLLSLNLLVWLVGGALPGAALLALAAYVTGFVVAIRLFRYSARRILWRVRNRMIVLFLFIGLLPLLLVAALAVLAGYVATGQLAVQMATAELDRRADRLQGLANALVWSLAASERGRRPELVKTYLERAAAHWPGLQIWTRNDADPPRAALRGVRGLVRRQGRFFLLAHASTAASAPAGDTDSSVIARPPAGASPPAPADAMEAMLLQPLTEGYLSDLTPGLGRTSLFATARNAVPLSEFRAGLPEPANRFDYEVIWGTLPLPIEDWSERDRDAHRVHLRIQTRPSAVFRRLFGQRAEVAQGVTYGFLGLGTLFLIVELISLVTGISITRTVTRRVHELYEGTQKVNQGIFSHRIGASGHDQLAELAQSFNSMTESIERLIEESKERERMASELQIAREVQEQLFPKAPPEMRTLEVLGVCHAARMVSGDYFDWVKLSDDRLALAIGDVAGKGISGALLMASIQSMLRTQLSIEASAAGESDGGLWRFPTAHLVTQLNLQLYQNTSSEKYATFFFAAYDDRHSLLTYTNAGHLPPVLIRRGQPRRLEVNGLVVGAFPFATYQQSEVQLEPGDLLVAFTDGASEPENEFAEEFGEPRLIELLVRHAHRSSREIIDEVIGAVSQWTGRPELQDDMTLLVARRP